MGVDGKERSKTRAQQRAAGTKKTALFEIVNRNYAATHSARAERAPRHAPFESGMKSPTRITAQQQCDKT
jgi:hypothetical protein